MLLEKKEKESLTLASKHLQHVIPQQGCKKYPVLPKLFLGFIFLGKPGQGSYPRGVSKKETRMNNSVLFMSLEEKGKYRNGNTLGKWEQKKSGCRKKKTRQITQLKPL